MYRHDRNAGALVLLDTRDPAQAKVAAKPSFWPKYKARQLLKTAPDIQNFVKSCTGKTLAFFLSPVSTIDELKSLIEKKEGIPTDDQRLIYGGGLLDGDKTLDDCNIQRNSTCHLVMGLRGGMMQATSGRLDFAALSSLQTKLAIVPIDGGQDGDAPLLSMSITGATTARDVLEALALADLGRAEQAATDALAGELGAADVDAMPKEQLREIVRRAQAAVATGARRFKRQRKAE
jgi:hypothetical protein